MKVHDDHMYHGAALIQIAEHPQFTAINSLRIRGNTVGNSYQINNDIAVSLKYAGTPVGRFNEYVFNFTQANLAELASIKDGYPKCFLALVCVQDREICCLPADELLSLAERRKIAAGRKEDVYSLLVTAPKGRSLRAYVNRPGRKGMMLGKALIVSRNGFPNQIFA